METQDSCCCDVGQRDAVHLPSPSPPANPDLFCISDTTETADHLNVKTKIKTPCESLKCIFFIFYVGLTQSCFGGET